MGSWTYDGDELNLTLMSDKVDVDLSVENAEWTLKQASETKLHVIMYFCCPEPYIDVEYTFYLLRQSDFYGALIVTPATVVVLLMLVSFWLPAGAVEKVLLNGVNVLICVSFLLYFWQCIAKMAEHTPYVGESFGMPYGSMRDCTIATNQNGHSPLFQQRSLYDRILDYRIGGIVERVPQSTVASGADTSAYCSGRLAGSNVAVALATDGCVGCEIEKDAAVSAIRSERA